MKRGFNVGDQIICRVSGVVGICIRFYKPIGRSEQAVALTKDGRMYHAPVEEWILIDDEVRGYVNSDLIINTVKTIMEKLGLLKA